MSRNSPLSPSGNAIWTLRSGLRFYVQKFTTFPQRERDLDLALWTAFLCPEIHHFPPAGTRSGPCALDCVFMSRNSPLSPSGNAIRTLRSGLRFYVQKFTTFPQRER